MSLVTYKYFIIAKNTLKKAFHRGKVYEFFTTGKVTVTVVPTSISLVKLI